MDLLFIALIGLAVLGVLIAVSAAFTAIIVLLGLGVILGPITCATGTVDPGTASAWFVAGAILLATLNAEREEERRRARASAIRKEKIRRLYGTALAHVQRPVAIASGTLGRATALTKRGYSKLHATWDAGSAHWLKASKQRIAAVRQRAWTRKIEENGEKSSRD